MATYEILIDGRPARYDRGDIETAALFLLEVGGDLHSMATLIAAVTLWRESYPDRADEATSVTVAARNWLEQTGGV